MNVGTLIDSLQVLDREMNVRIKTSDCSSAVLQFDDFVDLKPSVEFFTNKGTDETFVSLRLDV